VRYLLDSTLLIDHGHGDPAATELLRELVEAGHDLYTCDVVTCETLSRGDDEELRHLRALLDALEYVSISPTAARWAADSRRKRHEAGGKRSLGDALVAGVAVALGATVVTRNRPDYTRQGIAVREY
jgi:predicted nucleic acid-binding protein